MTKRSVAPGVGAAADGDRRSIQGYQPLHRLAQSYLGPLWVARRPADEDPEQLFLLRRLGVSTAEPDAVWDRILQAGRDALAIKHPQILPLLEPLREGSRLGFAYEHIEAEPLRALQSWANLRSLSFPVEVSLKVIIDVLTGIQAVHDGLSDPSLGFGGVSPDSVLVSRTGRTVVVDCAVAGCACLLDSFGGATSKLAYSSPEQLNLLAPLTAECDVFSCGILLWELLASRRFVGGSRAAIERKLREHQLPKLEDALRPGHGVPDDLLKLVTTALSADTADRPRTAAEFAHCLADCGHFVATEEQVADFVGLLSGQRFERRMTAIRSQSRPNFEAVRSPSQAPPAGEPEPADSPELAGSQSEPANATAAQLLRTDTPFGIESVKAVDPTELTQEPLTKEEPAERTPELSGKTITGMAVPSSHQTVQAKQEQPAEPVEEQSTFFPDELPDSTRTAMGLGLPDAEPRSAAGDSAAGDSAAGDSASAPESTVGEKTGNAFFGSNSNKPAASSSQSEKSEKPEVSKADSSAKADLRPTDGTVSESGKTPSTQRSGSTAPEEHLPVEREFDEALIAQRNSASPWNLRMGQSQPRRRVLAFGALALGAAAGLFFLMLPPSLSVQVTGTHSENETTKKTVQAIAETKPEPTVVETEPKETQQAPGKPTERHEQAVATKPQVEPQAELTPEPEPQAELTPEPEPTAMAREVQQFESAEFQVEILDDAKMIALFAAEPSQPLVACEKKQPLRRKTSRSKYAQAQRKKSRKALQAGDMDKVRMALCNAEQHHDPKGEAKRGLASLALQLGDGAQAQHWAELAVKRTPRDTNATDLLGDALAVQGDFAGAQKLWLKAVGGRNTDAKKRRMSAGFTRLGNKSLKRSGFSQARAFFRRALVLTQGGYGPSIGFSKSLLWLKAPKTARLWTTRAQAAYPKDAKIQLLHGDALFATGEPKAALKAWKISNKLRPNRSVRRRIAKGHP